MAEVKAVGPQIQTNVFLDLWRGASEFARGAERWVWTSCFPMRPLKPLHESLASERMWTVSNLWGIWCDELINQVTMTWLWSVGVSHRHHCNQPLLYPPPYIHNQIIPCSPTTLLDRTYALLLSGKPHRHKLVVFIRAGRFLNKLSAGSIYIVSASG